MGTLEDANRCVKYLNRSVLEGRLITVEKVIWSFAPGWSWGYARRLLIFMSVFYFQSIAWLFLTSGLLCVSPSNSHQSMNLDSLNHPFLDMSSASTILPRLYAQYAFLFAKDAVPRWYHLSSWSVGFYWIDLVLSNACMIILVRWLKVWYINNVSGSNLLICWRKLFLCPHRLRNSLLLLDKFFFSSYEVNLNRWWCP